MGIMLDATQEKSSDIAESIAATLLASHAIFPVAKLGLRQFEQRHDEYSGQHTWTNTITVKDIDLNPGTKPVQFDALLFPITQKITLNSHTGETEYRIETNNLSPGPSNEILKISYTSARKSPSSTPVEVTTIDLLNATGEKVRIILTKSDDETVKKLDKKNDLTKPKIKRDKTITQFEYDLESVLYREAATHAKADHIPEPELWAALLMNRVGNFSDQLYNELSARAEILEHRLNNYDSFRSDLADHWLKLNPNMFSASSPLESSLPGSQMLPIDTAQQVETIMQKLKLETLASELLESDRFSQIDRSKAEQIAAAEIPIIQQLSDIRRAYDQLRLPPELIEKMPLVKSLVAQIDAVRSTNPMRTYYAERKSAPETWTQTRIARIRSPGNLVPTDIPKVIVEDDNRTSLSGLSKTVNLPNGVKLTIGVGSYIDRTGNRIHHTALTAAPPIEIASKIAAFTLIVREVEGGEKTINISLLPIGSTLQYEIATTVPQNLGELKKCIHYISPMILNNSLGLPVDQAIQTDNNLSGVELTNLELDILERQLRSEHPSMPKEQFADLYADTASMLLHRKRDEVKLESSLARGKVDLSRFRDYATAFEDIDPQELEELGFKMIQQLITEPTYALAPPQLT